MNIKIDHVNITVENLKASAQWYEKVFSFQIVETGTTYLGKPFMILENNGFMIAMTERPLKTTDSNAEETEETRITNDKLFEHRIFHFGLRVPNQTDWEHILLREKIQVNYGGRVKYPHSTSWYVNDPNGHEIEVSYTDQPKLRFN